MSAERLERAAARLARLKPDQAWSPSAAVELLRAYHRLLLERGARGASFGVAMIRDVLADARPDVTGTPEAFEAWCRQVLASSPACIANDVHRASPVGFAGRRYAI